MRRIFLLCLGSLIFILNTMLMLYGIYGTYLMWFRRSNPDNMAPPMMIFLSGFLFVFLIPAIKNLIKGAK